MATTYEIEILSDRGTWSWKITRWVDDANPSLVEDGSKAYATAAEAEPDAVAAAAKWRTKGGAV